MQVLYFQVGVCYFLIHIRFIAVLSKLNLPNNSIMVQLQTLAITTVPAPLAILQYNLNLSPPYENFIFLVAASTSRQGRLYATKVMSYNSMVSLNCSPNNHMPHILISFNETPRAPSMGPPSTPTPP